VGSDDVEAINAVSGERCSPHPHVFSDRLIRPGDQAFFDIIQSYNGYRTCYYRTFNVGRATQSQRDAYKKAREWIDAGIDMVKPGLTTDVIAKAWPKAQDFGFDTEMEAFGLQFGHGLALGLHERPIISRLNSLDHPVALQEGMVFALETYGPASAGHAAARPGARHGPPRARPGGDLRRVCRGDAAGRLYVLHLSRPRSYACPRRLDGGRDGRVARPGQRHAPRQGRLDAPDRRQARRHGFLCD